MVICPVPLEVGRPCFERQHVLLLELDFRRVLDGHDALIIWNIGGEHVQQRGFAAAGTAGDDDVQPAFDAGFEKCRHLEG
jgi:hypothetical protein